MSELAVLHREIDTLPQHRVGEVLDFVGYLKQQDVAQQEEEMDEPNEETIAAFEEGEAMMRGDIPSIEFDSAEAFLADLKS